MPFRRLKHKAQVFFSPKNDHVCTRIEHALHVATIAATIARGLGFNTELAYAIGLGHDLGHTPFGHAGETALKESARTRFSRGGRGASGCSTQRIRAARFQPSGLNHTVGT